MEAGLHLVQWVSKVGMVVPFLQVTKQAQEGSGHTAPKWQSGLEPQSAWHPQVLRDGRTQLGVRCIECIPGRGTLFPLPLFCVPWGGSGVSTQQGHRGSSPGLPISLLSGPGCTHLGSRAEPSERKVFKHHGLYVFPRMAQRDWAQLEPARDPGM